MKRISGASQPIVVVPVVVDPVEVQDALTVVAVEVRDVEVTVGVASKYAKYLPEHHPLNTLRVESNLKT